MVTVQVTADIDFSKRHCGSYHTRHALGCTTGNLLLSTFMLFILHTYVHMHFFIFARNKIATNLCNYFLVPLAVICTRFSSGLCLPSLLFVLLFISFSVCY